MSDAIPATPAGVIAADPVRGNARTRMMRGAAWLVIALVLVALPFYLDEFWLRTGFAVFGAVIGAIGLNLITGTAGQLSLAHAFFLAVGATTYVFISGSPGGFAQKYGGLGWPPLVGMVLGVLLAGACGYLFSPIAGRLRGIYLGVASIALVFIGQHLLNTWTTVTGGFNGRTAPTFALGGFQFASENPYLEVLGVPFGQAERLWYLGLVLAAASYAFARNLIRSRPGRALQTLRDSEVAAAVMGVNVQAYKARAFAVSSMYAGLSGVLYALSIGSIAPESFGLDVSVQYLVMIVLGGLGSVGGAAIGALVVSAMPLVFQQYAGSLPFIAAPGQGGVTAGQAARYFYGAAIILMLIFQPAGLAGLAQRFKRGPRPGAETQPTAVPRTTPADQAAPAQSGAPSQTRSPSQTT